MTTTMTPYVSRPAAAQPEDQPFAAEQRLVDLGEMARTMFAQVGLAATVQTVLVLARRTFGCDDVAVLLDVDGGPLAPQAATSPAAGQAEAIQIEVRQGPGLQAVARLQPVISDDLRTDSRWRFYAPRAADLGYRSLLSLSLADGDTTGALTLYSRRPRAFRTEVLPLAQAFATHTSIALAIARERDQLLQAVEARGIVGQAQGLLMEQYDITAEQAETVLRRYAAHLDQNLRQVAEHFVLDRALPSLDDAAAVGRVIRPAFPQAT